MMVSVYYLIKVVWVVGESYRYLVKSHKIQFKPILRV